MSTTRHTQSLPLSRGSEIAGSYVGAEREARARWEALVDARLIGDAQPLSAEALAGIAAWEAGLGVGGGRRGG